MRIAIDARTYSWAGVGRYTRNLLAGLATLSSQHEFIVLLGERDARLFSELKKTFPGRNFAISVVDSSYYSWREQIILWRQLSAVRADLWHFIHFNIPLLFSKPYVLTVHDTTRLIFPGQTQQGLVRQLAYEQVFKHALERSQALICVSSATRREVAGLPFSLPAAVTTIHEGVDDLFLRPTLTADRQRIRLMIGTRDPYLLYVGVWMNHKNLPRLLAAYAQVREKYPYLKLVLTGKPKPGYVAVDKQARLLGIDSDSILYLGFVPDQLLPALYTEAACLIFPSLYEGFGLPALESAACGTPVVTSNVSSLPEIMGSAAEYVNPEYVPDIVRGIVHVLGDARYRQSLIESGRKQAQKFDWSTTARKHMAVYEQAVKA